MSDVLGTQRIEVHEGDSRISFEIDYGAGSRPDPGPASTPTTEPTETPQPDTPTPTPVPPTPTVTPTPTATPVPLDITSFVISLDEINKDNPCSSQIAWTVTGNPNGLVRLLRQSGSSISLGTATVLFQASPGLGSFQEPFSAGTRTYQVVASSPTQLQFSAPITVSPICIDSFRVESNP